MMFLNARINVTERPFAKERQAHADATFRTSFWSAGTRPDSGTVRTLLHTDTRRSWGRNHKGRAAIGRWNPKVGAAISGWRKCLLPIFEPQQAEHSYRFEEGKGGFRSYQEDVRKK